MNRQRTILLADAALVATAGAAALATAGWLSGHLTIPRTAIAALAIGMLVYALQLWLGATQVSPVRPFLLVALAGDIIWIAATLALLLARGEQMSATGIGLVVAASVVVTGFGIAEWRAVRPRVRTT